MKKIKLSFLLIITLITGIKAQEGVKYIDATQLTLTGKIAPTPNPYHRIDTALYPTLTATENRLVRCSSGLALVFRSNSPTIWIKTKYGYRYSGTGTPLIASTGYDMYVKSGGQWLYAYSGTSSDPEKPFQLISDMDSSPKECLLYLPMYSEVLGLEIGIREDAYIEAIENPFRHKIVIFGSSYTQGSNISHSGMTYPMQISRNTGLYIVNLGVSGNSLLQPVFAEILSRSDAEAFIFDAFSNPSAELIEQRLIPFIRRIRESHPKTPLIFLQTIVREGGNFNEKVRNHEAKKRAMAEKMMKQAMTEFNDVYFINLPNLTGTDHITSADGVHPSDLGYYRWAQRIQPSIVKILKKYGIK
jgi:hypothetical protein